MDRREFLGVAATAGVGAAVGGYMGLKEYDSASGEFIPTRAMAYDASKAMPYWKGVPMYEYDSSTGDFVDTYLNDGLVGYWDFQPSSITGNSVEDRSTNHNAGTLHGNPDVSDGIVGQELIFDGTDDAMTVPHNDALNIQTGDFTIAVWLHADIAAETKNWTNSHEHGIIERKARSGHHDATSAYTLCVVDKSSYTADKDSSFVFVFGDGTNVYSLDGEPVTAGPQYHAVVTFEQANNTATIYIDGRQRSQKSFSAAPVVNQRPLQVGTHHTTDGSVNRRLEGGMSELRLYDRALSKAEIRSLAGLGAGVGPTFEVTHIKTPFPQGWTDPVGIYNPDKAKPYRLSIFGTANETSYGHNGNDLYESSDGLNWSLVEKDIAGVRTIQDYVYVNGTYYAYDAGADTFGWSGPDFENLSPMGRVLDGVTDVGAFYENGTYYLYPEELPVGHSPSGDRIGVYTSDRPDGGFTRQGTALDYTDRVYATGDADIEKIDGTYWMFADCEYDHPYYGTSLAKSDDLINWDFVTDDIKQYPAGDLDVLQTPDGLIGFTEMTIGRELGVGVWDVTYHPEGWQ